MLVWEGSVLAGQAMFTIAFVRLPAQEPCSIQQRIETLVGGEGLYQLPKVGASS